MHGRDDARKCVISGPTGSSIPEAGVYHCLAMKNTPRFISLLVVLVLSTLPASAHLWRGCLDDGVVASAIKTRGDIRAFVECAAEFLRSVGPEEAGHAFAEDGPWKHGEIYIFVDGIAKSGTESMTFLFPPDPSREGQAWGEAIDDFGTDYFYEVWRMMEVVDAGWIYYSFTNPATGTSSPKASYLIEIQWEGNRAVIGAGIYEPDLPSTCRSDEVNAQALGADPRPETLAAFVRCAAMVVESGGYFALDQIERDPRWRNGLNYVFLMDLMGNQVASGFPLRVNGYAPHEWYTATADKFGGRNIIGMAEIFGEAYVYYEGFDPTTGATHPKVAFLKRIVAHGVPLIIGSGYATQRDQSAVRTSCEDRVVTAGAIRSRDQIPAFVRCAAEYLMEHGTDEARRAFKEDGVWKHDETGIYVFVDALRPSGEDAMSFVFPPDPSLEGTIWGTSIDDLGTDYFFELYRVLSLVDSGWLHYSFTDPSTGLWNPKSSYVMEIDWNGERAAIGAGFYSNDLPGTCDPGIVNAEALEHERNETMLMEFVRCAALRVESAGHFAGSVLETDPRWNEGSIYPFVIDAADGTTLFSSNPASFEFSGRVEVLFDGRNMVEATDQFGETFWYYRSTNSGTGMVQTTTSFVKRIVAQGMPLLVGAGYNPESHH